MSRSNQAASVAILGGGNIGHAMALGFVREGSLAAKNLFVTRRKTQLIGDLAEQGIQTGSDNRAAVQQSDIIIVALQPAHMPGVLKEISDMLEPGRHILCSVATAITCAELEQAIDKDIPVFRVMPNTAAARGASMTCISTNSQSTQAQTAVEGLFEKLGRVLFMEEELISSATVLAACGIAYALRFIRAASQGGIEIGFHAEEALTMAAQTVKGAAELLLSGDNHPEREIDKVTTPQGCTIAGLNEMEHRGFSSALIKGIITSKNKISLMKPEN